MTVVTLDNHGYPKRDTIAVPPGWKQMSSGKGIDLAKPDPAVVDFNDIADALSKICRFNGATNGPENFYSVAQHSVLVCDLLPPPLRAYGLLHDAHEAYVGDQVTPFKRLMAVECPEGAAWLDALKHGWDRAIFAAAGITDWNVDGWTPSLDARDAVKQADLIALSIERDDLLAAPADKTTHEAWAWAPATSGMHVRPLLPEQARDLFTYRLATLIWPTAHIQRKAAA